MQKRILPKARQQTGQLPNDSWLNLEPITNVELTSEDPAYPIESALLPTSGPGWRAAEPGTQTIRLVFASPQEIRRIWLEFVEPSTDRTQEFVLRWSADAGKSFQEIVRQQWNFNPTNASREIEDYSVQLSPVSMIELVIIPDTRRGEARATLARLRLA